MEKSVSKSDKNAAKKSFFDLKNKETQSLLWTILLILFVRGFLLEPFKIPSGSMIPSLLVGDHLFVGKATYRLHIPFTQIEWLPIAEPRPGDVVVFYYPNYEKDPSRDRIHYIKRLIGVPGDKIRVEGGVPIINGRALEQDALPGAPSESISPEFDFNEKNQVFMEKMPGKSRPYTVQRKPGQFADLEEAILEQIAITGRDCIPLPSENELISLSSGRRLGLNQICEFTVPEDRYFVMGDNRDDSSDGRAWGFVKREMLIGKALFIWLSSKPEYEGGGFWFFPWNWRWSRIGKGIY